MLRLFSFLALSLAVSVMADDPKPDPREKLETAIPEAIRLLKAKEYATFIKSYMAPDDLKKITERVPLEELVKGFGGRKADRLLKVLEAIRGTQPKLDDAGTTAVFTLKEEIDSAKRITFVKIDKRWYIRNR